MPRLIIGLTGLRGTEETGYTQAQAGKDTVADRLVAEHGFMRLGLADGVRESLYALDPYVGPVAGGVVPEHPSPSTALRLSEVVDSLGWERAKVEIEEVRALMQRMGTDAGRRVHGEHLWLALAAHKMAQHSPDQPFVITDVRFPNEGTWVNRQGGFVVRVERPDESVVVGANALHASETSWHGIKVDEVLLNDGTIEELHHRVDKLVRHLSLVRQQG